MHHRESLGYCSLWVVLVCASAFAQSSAPKIISKPALHKALREPPCSYASTQHRKGFVRNDDRVIAWLRASHNGGAIPLRLFLSVPRVINDTYGLFFFDADGEYVSAFPKDYGYEFYGWRNGVMVVRGGDGTLWSALSGRAFEGLQKGRQLQRIPSLMTDWGHWLMLHPESTAYDLYDGKKYPSAPLPTQMSAEAQETMATVDGRLQSMASVLGVLAGSQAKAFPLEKLGERACFTDRLATVPIAVFWYGPTRSAVAYNAMLDNRKLTFYADDISPETAPFKDKETGTRWTLAGRGVDGPLKGRELTWVNSVQCRWYAWSAEYPETAIYSSPSSHRK